MTFLFVCSLLAGGSVAGIGTQRRRHGDEIDVGRGGSRHLRDEREAGLAGQVIRRACSRFVP